MTTVRLIIYVSHFFVIKFCPRNVGMAAVVKCYSLTADKLSPFWEVTTEMKYNIALYLRALG